MRITLSVSFILFAGAVACAFDATAAAGDADPSFGGAGYVRYAAPKTVAGLFSAILAQDDGSVIAAGSADTEVFVRHYRVDGNPLKIQAVPVPEDIRAMCEADTAGG